MIGRRHGNAFRALIELAIAHERGVHKKIRHVLGADRDLDRERRLACFDHLLRVQLAAFRGHEHVRFRYAGHDEHLRDVAAAIGLFVGGDLQALSLTAVPASGRSCNPDVGDTIPPHGLQEFSPRRELCSDPPAFMTNETFALPLASVRESVCCTGAVADFPPPLSNGVRSAPHARESGSVRHHNRAPRC